MEKEYEELLRNCYEQEACLTELTPSLLRLADQFAENCTFLYDIHRALAEGVDFLEDFQVEVSFHKLEDRFELKFQNRVQVFNEEQLQCFIATTICVLEPMLPLGSVVELKKEYFPQLIDPDIKRVKIVITHRFLCLKDRKYYFPYAGVVYPVGTLFEEKYVQFTPPLIKRLTHQGYTNRYERSLVYQMKKELVQKKRMRHFGFASEEDSADYQKKLSEVN